MVLVDTSVRVDFFGNRPEPPVTALRRSIEIDTDLSLCGIILAEVLQGIRSDSDYRRTKARLEALIFLPIREATFVHAADICRSFRKRGVTIRKTVDCIIASSVTWNRTSPGR